MVSPEPETFHNWWRLIPQEIGGVLDNVEERQAEALVAATLSCRRLFGAGAGRSLAVTEMFLKRLMHLGVDARAVGEPTLPPISAEDALLLSSGSGEKRTLEALAEVARQAGGKVLVVTANSESSLARRADVGVVLPAKMKLPGVHTSSETSRQMMGSLFEQSLLVFYDGVAEVIRRRLGREEDFFWSRHTNLE